MVGAYHLRPNYGLHSLCLDSAAPSSPISVTALSGDVTLVTYRVSIRRLGALRWYCY